MDLREIQRLHEHYARQPVTIDMPPGATSGSPWALPSPGEAATAARLRWGALGQRTRMLLMILGTAGLAAAAGMSAASLEKRWSTGKDTLPEVHTRREGTTPEAASAPALPAAAGEKLAGPTASASESGVVADTAPTTGPTIKASDFAPVRPPPPALAPAATTDGAAHRPSAVSPPRTTVKVPPASPDRPTSPSPASAHGGDVKLF